MPIGVSVDQLLEYTEWERDKWREWFEQQGSRALADSAGPNGDGRFTTIGDLVKHIFSAEKRYVERLSERPLTDTASLPSNNVDALFEFGRQSRKDLKDMLATFPAAAWDAPKEFNIVKYSLTATPKKIIFHVLMHEIRHWAQISTLLRLNGMTGAFHDFLFSPVLGGESRVIGK